jgi:hypothetical protein
MENASRVVLDSHFAMENVSMSQLRVSTVENVALRVMRQNTALRGNARYAIFHCSFAMESASILHLIQTTVTSAATPAHRVFATTTNANVKKDRHFAMQVLLMKLVKILKKALAENASHLKLSVTENAWIPLPIQTTVMCVVTNVLQASAAAELASVMLEKLYALLKPQRRLARCLVATPVLVVNVAKGAKMGNAMAICAARKD